MGDLIMFPAPKEEVLCQGIDGEPCVVKAYAAFFLIGVSDNDVKEIAVCGHCYGEM